MSNPTLPGSHEGSGRLRHKTVVLGVTGSIAAFKSVEIARLLLQSGMQVSPVLTHSGARIVTPMTFTALCGRAARTEMWDATYAGELHIALSSEADALLVAPATADFIARMASGRADDLLAAMVLVARCPVLIAPAMHPLMWAHPATQRNVQTILADGRVKFVGPVVGQVANGDTGLGRMAQPADIVAALQALLRPQDLHGVRLVVTAGPTVEDLDPVRYLTNRSTGKMGFAIASRAASRGAEVTLIAGPVQLATPQGVHRVDVRSALQMQSALHEVLGVRLAGADVLIMSAAVGDYRFAATSEAKVKRSQEALHLELVPNPDLLAEIGAARSSRRPLLVGFAVETGTDAEIIDRARGKLESKRVDLVVANAASDGFGGDDNRASIVGKAGVETMDRMSKQDLADRILDRVSEGLRGESAL